MVPLPVQMGLQRWWEQEIPVDVAINKGELMTHNLTELIKPESYEVRLTPITRFGEGDSTIRIVTYSGECCALTQEIWLILEEKCRETRAGGRRRRDALSLILRLHRWKNYNYSLWCHPSANSELVSRVCASVSWHMFIKFSLVSPSPRLWFPSFIVSCMRKDSL